MSEADLSELGFAFCPTFDDFRDFVLPLVKSSLDIFSLEYRGIDIPLFYQ
jgi:hypothetical protein